MLGSALIRQYANGARVSPEVAGQDIALHYALALLNDRGLIGRPPGGGPPGPLLFKGGTALRKCGADDGWLADGDPRAGSCPRRSWTSVNLSPPDQLRHSSPFGGQSATVRQGGQL
jgi:hypothetical protein